MDREDVTFQSAKPLGAVENQAAKPLGAVCPTCGDRSGDERFCTECGEVFGFTNNNNNEYGI